MNPKVQQYFLDVIDGRKTDRKALALAKILGALAVIYGLLVQSRVFLYRVGVLRRKTLGCVILSVGNLTVGGTGKTPVVEMLARSLAQGGRRVAVLSRGYKREKQFCLRRWWNTRFQYQPGIVSDGHSVRMESAEAGDEPFMLAKNLAGVAVLVDKNRVKSGSYAIEKMGADTLILDDGFQYMPLGRRVDIVLVDSTNPFGNERMLPRGLLREPIKNIGRADMIFLTKSDGANANPIVERIRAANPKAPIVECQHDPKHLVEVATGSVKPLDFLRGKRVAAVTAIASPEGFEKALKHLGAELVLSRRFPDHHRFTERDLTEAIKEGARNKIEAILTTEKDAVRFPPLEKKNVPVYYLRVEIRIRSGLADFKDCIARVCNP